MTLDRRVGQLANISVFITEGVLIFQIVRVLVRTCLVCIQYRNWQGDERLKQALAPERNTAKLRRASSSSGISN